MTRWRPLAQGAALFAAVPLVVGLLAGSPPPLGIYVVGLIIGSLYGLVAIGLILVYQATRIINFAGAQLGSAAATLALLLMSRRGLPFALALPLAIAGGVVIGAVVDVLVIRRFRSAPRLILTVATIGVAQILAFVEFLIPKWVTGDAFLPNDYPTPFDDLTFRIGVVRLSGNHVFAVVAVAALAGGLTAFFRRSRVGIAVRAAAENADRAALLGIPVRRLSTVVWALAGGLSAIGVFVRAPMVGLPVGGFTGPGLLLFGLAAAVIAQMRDLPTALLAGAWIGMVDQASVFATRRSSVSYGVMLAVVLVALVAQRRSLSRAFDTGQSSYQIMAPLRPIPPELRALRSVRVVRALGVLAALALSIVAPYLVGEERRGLLTLVVITAILGISLVVLTGWAGQISLGQFAIAGVGAAVAGSAAAHWQADLFLCLGAGVLAAAAASVVIGIPALRLQGLLLAVTTLAFAFTVQFIVLNPDYTGDFLPGQDGTFIERPRLYGLVDLSSDIAFYFLTLAFFGLTVAVARALRRYRSGRIFIAVKDNVRTAQASGLSTARTRLAAFAIAGGIAGLAGGLLAYQQESVDALTFNPTTSITMFAMTVIGGVTSILGAVLGALYVRGIPYLLESQIEGVGVLSTGVGLLVLLLVLPGGLAEGVFRIRDRWLRGVARRNGIDVPSLAGAASTPGPTGTVTAPAPPTPSRSGAHGDEPVPTLLRCEGVELSYGQVQILFGIDLHLRPGEALALLGTNGAGKSTLLRAISGLNKTSAGSITFDGEQISGCDAKGIVQRGIVQVPGGKAVFPTLTVAEHFRLASWIDASSSASDEATEVVLSQFPRLRDRWNQLAGDLSGGEQQMLGLGMAFVLRPKVVLIDELSLGLAPAVVEQLLGIIREMQAAGTAVVLVEQSLNVALTVCDRAYFLEKGQVRFEGPTADLLEREDLARSVFLSGPSRDQRRPVERVPSPSTEDARPILVVEGVTRSYGGIQAVAGVDLEVLPGETVGFVGPNGAGKTTLFDLITGHQQPDAGRVLFDGVDVSSWSPDRRSRNGLGRSMQDARLFPSLTVAENLAVSLDRHLPVRDHLAAALGLPAVRELEVDIAWSVDDLIDLMNLGPFRNRFISELSTGTRRVVDLAMCLGHDPSVLLLDEPSSGMAQRETEQLAPLLARVREEVGCAILVIEHDIPFIREVSDRLVAMVLGAPVAVGRADQVLQDPTVVAAYLGTDEATVNRSGTAPEVRRRLAASR